MCASVQDLDRRLRRLGLRRQARLQMRHASPLAFSRLDFAVAMRGARTCSEKRGASECEAESALEAGRMSRTAGCGGEEEWGWPTP
eukprot:2460238-Pleurochrysis_carterae.AAC.1